jgi:hypothetical protein
MVFSHRTSSVILDSCGIDVSVAWQSGQGLAIRRHEDTRRRRHSRLRRVVVHTDPRSVLQKVWRWFGLKRMTNMLFPIPNVVPHEAA